MAYILVTDENIGADRFEITKETHTIGRGSGCDLQILHRTVSRSHAVVRVNAQGQFVLRDDESTGGTYVNDIKITEQVLLDGDHIRVGEVKMVFHGDATGEQDEENRQSDYTIVHSLSSEFGDTTLLGAERGRSDLNKRLHLIYEISEFIFQSFDIDEISRRILEKIFTAIQAERAVIILRDRASGKLRTQVSMDRQGRELPMPYSRTIVNKVMEQGHSLLLSNVLEHEGLREAMSIQQQNIRSALCVPIRTRNNIIGAIDVDASGVSAFSDNDLELLTIIGNQAGLVIENARLIDENVRAARLAAVGQTVASLAHCIKNILQGLKGGGSLMDEGIENGNMSFINTAWRVMKKSQYNITELVLNMLDYSKDREPAYVPADLGEQMHSVTDIMSARAKEFGVGFELRCDEGIPEVDCDPLGIYRATLNLVTNALDAVRPKGEQGKVELRLTQPDRETVQIEVIDNGAGIPDEVMPRLFEPFHSTKDSRGTGLGLAVSRKIVREHGGEIDVWTESGSGTRFTIALPIRCPEN